MTSSKDNILTVRGLKTYFPVHSGGILPRAKRYVKAVDGVDFVIPRGKTLGLVGESGSGKTTIGRSILRLIPHTAGCAFFDGQDVFALSGSRLRDLRKRVQIVFQDPVGSLNPRMTVEQIVSEPLKVHTRMSRKQRRSEVAGLLERVGLSAEYASRYPHEFSGGQRQRIGIARALAPKPDFIVCDEPVSALDVSIQAQILNLLSDLQKDLGLSYLFIAHNLAVVEHFADIVAVMYLGRIVEIADRDTLYSNPQHPYTKALLSAVPKPVANLNPDRIRLPGEIPSPIDPPSGCTFYPRCQLSRQLAAKSQCSSETHTLIHEGKTSHVMRQCMAEVPKLEPIAENCTHLHACMLARNAKTQ